MTDRATVSPPKPESKIPIGASRVMVGTGARLGRAGCEWHAVGGVGPVTCRVIRHPSRVRGDPLHQRDEVGRQLLAGGGEGVLDVRRDDGPCIAVDQTVRLQRCLLYTSP